MSTSILYLCAQLLAGLVILSMGAEAFIRGAVRVAERLGLSRIVIGLTLVAFGTSAPELAVNLSAALKGSTEMALGNVVGSNIANIGMILGVAAIVAPLIVHMSLLRKEVPLLFLVTLLLYLLSGDGQIDRMEGLLLLSIFVLVTLLMVRAASSVEKPAQAELTHVAERKAKTQPLLLDLLLVVLGLAALVGGGEMMVRAAVGLAQAWGMSEMVIGLTVIAIGTSLPELAASVLAARRGETDIAVGNVIGSNLSNILLILGATAAVQPVNVPPIALRFDLLFLLGFTTVLVPILRRGFIVSRLEGVLLLLAYLGYLAWQIFVANS